MQHQRRQQLIADGAIRRIRDEQRLIDISYAIAPQKAPLFTFALSSALRFWLIFRLASIRVMGSRTPTMPRNCARMKSRGASLTAQGRGARRLVKVGQARDDIEQAVGILEELDRAAAWTAT